MEAKVEPAPSRKATLVGVVAILLWASLALFTTRARGIPPFELLALSLGVAFGLGLTILAAGGRRRLAELRQPAGAWLCAFAAIFLYHALYFCALSWAPAAQASLIAYLWPLLIVVFTAGQHLDRPIVWAPCLAGSILGFAGTATIVLDGHSAVRPDYLWGYLAALGCALVWSSYSVFNRRFRDAPSGMLVGVCGAVAVAGLACHLGVESWVSPSLRQWLAIAALGAGPTGFAFFAWDHATKHGHVAYLGLLSYLAPLISTALLLAAREVEFSPGLAASAVLIIGGALVPKLAEVALGAAAATGAGKARRNRV